MAALAEQIEACTERSGWPLLYDDEVAAEIRERFPTGAAADFLAAVASGSPYLYRLFTQKMPMLTELLAMPPEMALQAIFEETQEAGQEQDMEGAKAQLRALKARIAMLLALMDLSGLWTTEKIMEALSRFADRAVAAAFSVSLRSLFPEESLPLESTGMGIFAMGKHGAGELNYSSDVDLVVFYNQDVLASQLDGRRLPPRMKTAKQIAVQVTRLAVDILQEQRSDGYVFRTDLRLRPDPGSSAIAVTLATAEYYYEAYGQNWERAAFIKCRMIAGDPSIDEALKQILTPFIWRKYLDYAAIADIHGIKRQIHAVKGSGDAGFAGHDIKIGRGGIREIEFLAQTQQLILGGKEPVLRCPKTLDTLQALVVEEQIEAETADRLKRAYLFLRHIEHRIQMVNDEQTHMLPKRPEQILRLARLSGFKTAEALGAALGETLDFVAGAYARLFHKEDAREEDMLAFTGLDESPATLQALSDMGFQRGSAIAEEIRHWFAGGIKAARSGRARAILPSIIPSLLRALAHADDPDAAFSAFNTFLHNLPAGVQFFSLVQNNPGVLEIITDLVSLSPRHREILAHHAYYIEALLDESFLGGDPGDQIEPYTLTDEALRAPNFEEALNVLRRRVKEARFQVSCHLLLKDTDTRVSGRAASRIADATLKAALPVARREVERSHGRLPPDQTGELAVIGMGRLGAEVLTATSDLDLIFIYDCPPGVVSDGKKPLDGVTWYTRYVRRLVTTLSAQTEEGDLYDVDMALRPSGGAGPAAVSLSAFDKYYEKDAWTWEEMALVKARVITGEGSLPDRLSERIDNILTRQREPGKIRADALEMRQRLLKAKPAAGIRDVKLVKGGQTEVDFICQVLSLIHGHEHGRFPLHLAEAIEAFRARGILSDDEAAQLEIARRDYEILLQFKRTTLGDSTSRLFPAPLEERLAARLGLDGPDRIDRHLLAHQQAVSAIFARYVGKL